MNMLHVQSVGLASDCILCADLFALHFEAEQKLLFLKEFSWIGVRFQRKPSTSPSSSEAAFLQGVALSQKMRVIAIWVGGDLRRSPVQPPAQIRIIPGCFIQLDLKSLQGWRWHKLSGQPSPLLLLTG